MEQAEIPNILTAVDNEKFRRRLLIGSRVLAVLLIFAIFFIGFVQIKYVKEVNDYRAQYGSRWSCYLCGLEKGRSCVCSYLPYTAMNNPNFDLDGWFENIADGNIIPCEDRNEKKGLDINISGLMRE